MNKDYRDALIGASNLRKFRYVFVTVIASIGGFIALIMLCSYLFAGPPQPWHPPYRPTCKGSGLKEVLENHDDSGIVTTQTIVCGDGFSYTVSTGN